MSYNRKFLVLPMGNEVTISPGHRVIKAEEFDELLDIQQVIDRAKIEIQELHNEKLVESKQLSEEAEERGFQKGLEKFAQLLSDIEEEGKNIRKKLEPLIIKIAVKAAQSVIEKELHINPSNISSIVAKTLRSVAQHKSVSLLCNEHDLTALTENRPELEAILGQSSQIHIAARNDLPRFGYIIQTERGIINRTNIEEVWKKLETFLLKQLEGSPEQQVITQENEL